MSDALRNDLRAENPHYSNDQINNIVIQTMFDSWMHDGTFYSLTYIPNMMRQDYGNVNTFLIPEYAAFRERGDALLRHQWNYLASMMPFTLPPHMTYDFFRNQFRDSYTWWATRATDPGNTILHWVNFPAEEQARARMARQRPEDRRYDFLSREDEARLNRVMLEIDPHFRPVDTIRTSNARLLQDFQDAQRGR